MNKENLKELISTTSTKGWARNKKIKENMNFINAQVPFLDPETTSLSEKFYCILNNIHERPICKCGDFIIYNRGLEGYKNSCYRGRKCLSSIENFKKKIKKTCLEKYGVENPFQSDDVKKKIKNNYTEKYGVDHHSKLKMTQDKIKKTCLEKYGVSNASKSDVIKNKIKISKIEKYGDENYNNREKFKKTCLERHYRDVIANYTHATPLFRLEEYSGVIHYNKKYDWVCTTCDTEFIDDLKSGVPRCPICLPLGKGGVSGLELEVSNFISGYIDDIETNKRYYYGTERGRYYELDIYLPSLNIGFEIDGLYWHSELGGKSSKYHIDKTNYFKEKGINVFHIFENEWLNKKDIVKSIILNKIGKSNKRIYARKCIIREIDNKEMTIFLDTNHLQGNILAKHRVGLFYNDELVSLATFSRPRYNSKYKFELLRFCNKLDTSVVGGFSKLLTYFIKKNGTSIISYCDIRYSDGNSYIKNKFELSHISKPNYWYFKNHKYILESRIKYQKHKLKNILEKYNENLSEWENMQLNSYNRIWDCGNYVFTID